FFFSSRRRHTRFSRDWSSDVCSSDLCRIKVFSGGWPSRDGKSGAGARVWQSRTGRPSFSAQRSTCSRQSLRATFARLLQQISTRSEEHTSELQSRENLVCRLLLEKKN